jgi:N-acetylneuraminate synthase
MSFFVGNRLIGEHPVYWIADIASNHDGSLGRAKDLIKLAKDSGADCAKFQHFQASRIVSAVGFDGFKTAHQRGWDKSVFEVYEDYSINPDWNEELAQTCKDVGIDFMTTPYDIETVDSIDHLVNAYKIGSGDITYPQLMQEIARKDKPIFLATGASTMEEVETAVRHLWNSGNTQLCLMQCNTDYSGHPSYKCINLNVLKTYAKRWPTLPLGLSDHTPEPTSVLGAIALGATVIEKHFTDDRTRKGPDHGFAIEPDDWAKMRAMGEILQREMGDGVKRVEANEVDSRIVQRRAIRIKDASKKLSEDNVEFLRPCPDGALTPAEVDRVLHRRLKRPIESGSALHEADLE